MDSGLIQGLFTSNEISNLFFYLPFLPASQPTQTDKILCNIFPLKRTKFVRLCLNACLGWLKSLFCLVHNLFGPIWNWLPGHKCLCARLSSQLSVSHRECVADGYVRTIDLYLDYKFVHFPFGSPLSGCSHGMLLVSSSLLQPQPRPLPTRLHWLVVDLGPTCSQGLCQLAGNKVK